MYKYKAMEIAQDAHLIGDVENGNIRKCSRCGAYVSVYDYAAEVEGNVVEACDDCIEKIISGKQKQIKTFEEDDYEYYLEDDEEDFEEDDE